MRHIHVLALGQSNGANHGGPLTQSKFGRCFAPDGSAHPMADPIPGGTGGQGSIWPNVAERLHQTRPDLQFNLTLRSVGGTAMEDWAPGGKCLASLLPDLSMLAHHEPAVTHILWHQGERDTMLNTTRQAYLDGFAAMHAALVLAVPVPWIVCRASYRMGVVSPEVIAAQNQIIAEYPGFLAGPDTDQWGEDLRRDRTLFNAEGQRLFADAVAQVLALHGSQPDAKNQYM